MKQNYGNKNMNSNYHSLCKLEIIMNWNCNSYPRKYRDYLIKLINLNMKREDKIINSRENLFKIKILKLMTSSINYRECDKNMKMKHNGY